MKQSKILLNKRLNKDLAFLTIQISCDHLWEEHGHGYQCEKCLYYTGMNTEMNELINKEKVEIPNEILCKELFAKHYAFSKNVSYQTGLIVSELLLKFIRNQISVLKSKAGVTKEELTEAITAARNKWERRPKIKIQFRIDPLKNSSFYTFYYKQMHLCSVDCKGKFKLNKINLMSIRGGVPEMEETIDILLATINNGKNKYDN